MAAAGKLRQDPAIIEALPAFQNGTPDFSGCMLLEVGPDLRVEDRNWGHPDEAAGVAQLEYVERGYALAREHGWPLITAPVSKEVIARCGLRRARTFRGHTEWLEKLDAAGHSVMCFSSSRLTCSLVTTHVPIRALAKAISPQLVTKACCELVDLLLRRGVSRPRVAVCSLNPHGGEGELLGKEEGSAILPGIRDAASVVGRRAKLLGPAGAETAFRKAAAGDYDGVVAMYHDQATIPMKLLDFGGAVNVTQGLSIVRTSVDHGTAYDIAGEGVVDARGMMAALDLGLELSGTKRRIQHGSW
jgi:4-hydroxythreonine-4-phosphate dehydrogenase